MAGGTGWPALGVNRPPTVTLAILAAKPLLIREELSLRRGHDRRRSQSRHIGSFERENSSLPANLRGSRSGADPHAPLLPALLTIISKISKTFGV